MSIWTDKIKQKSQSMGGERGSSTKENYAPTYINCCNTSPGRCDPCTGTPCCHSQKRPGQVSTSRSRGLGLDPCSGNPHNFDTWDILRWPQKIGRAPEWRGPSTSFSASLHERIRDRYNEGKTGQTTTPMGEPQLVLVKLSFLGAYYIGTY